MKEVIQVNKIFNKYNIDQKRYEAICYLTTKELALYGYTSKMNMGKNFLFKRALEIIKAINISTESNINKVCSSLPNYDHRVNNSLNTNLEKQLFINNFIFDDNEKFVHSLKINNIKIEDVENLHNAIMEQKKVSKETSNYELDIKNICDLSGVCTYFNFNNQEIIINKICELYYLNPEILDKLKNEKKH